MSEPTAIPAPFRPSFANEAELDDFVATLERFERGELDAEGWKAYRVLRGVYGQRQDAVHMQRVKLPQGLVSAPQLRALAAIARDYSRGFGHVTTRQDFQLHFVKQEHLAPLQRALEAAGLTSLGACGNAVRNVVACPLAGVARGEPFDVTPYAEAVSRHFLAHPLALALPRKFKIGFEGCPEDHAATAIHDIGFRARIRTREGRLERGFAVTVAGGTSIMPTSAWALAEFLPAEETLALAEAIVRVFHAHGDYQNRKRNRLKFLVKAIGWDRFRALVDEALARVRAEGIPALPFDPQRPPEESPPAHARRPPPDPAAIAARVRAERPHGPGLHPPAQPDLSPSTAELALFLRTNVVAQRQPGYAAVTVAPPQGDLTAPQLEVLADLALAHGDGTARFTNGGRVLLRWIPHAALAALHAALAAAGLARSGPGSAGDVVSCPGAEACRLAVTGTRGVARRIEQRVRTRLGEAALEAALPIHVSGCPNGCSQHHVAAIGLQGSVRKVAGRAVAQYFVLLGGSAADGAARFGTLAAKIPARRIPEAVERLTLFFLSERREGETAGAFFTREAERARELVAPLEALAPEEVAPEDLAEDAA